MWKELFERLYDFYGSRGWWPLISRAGKEGRDEAGYLPGAGPPSDRSGIFEVAVGAVLTQNTAWTNAERALIRLAESNLLTCEGLSSVPPGVLAETIRSAGYYNSKARKLTQLSDFFYRLDKNGSIYSIPSRDSLLSLWGIGPETADSILLYGFGVPTFVIDSYTQRIAERIGFFRSGGTSEELKFDVERALPRNWTVYAEFHALIVEHGKQVCRKSPLCGNCFLSRFCESRMYT